MSEDMKRKGRMVVAGSDRLILPLAAIGFEAVRCGGSSDLVKALETLKKRREVVLVVCGESQAGGATETIEAFRATSPAILLVVPDGVAGRRLDAALRRGARERAAGGDLLGKELGKGK